MVVTINLNTSFNQLSLITLKFVCYLYVMVLLGNKFCFVEQIHACIIFRPWVRLMPREDTIEVI